MNKLFSLTLSFPPAEFHGLWESLVYDMEIKQKVRQWWCESKARGVPSCVSYSRPVQLLDYAETTLIFSDRGVDANVISWNRVLLLHGQRFS